MATFRMRPPAGVVVQEVFGGDGGGGFDRAPVKALAGGVPDLFGLIPAGSVPPVTALAEQELRAPPVAVPGRGVLVTDYEDRAAVLGMVADDPGQVMADRIGGEGQPRTFRGSVPVPAAPGAALFMAADGLDSGRIFDGDVCVVHHRQTGYGVVGVHAVSDGLKAMHSAVSLGLGVL
ncbi:hypothetical protein AB0945_43800 [Streptomyces sp. NPDC005474]|uniref:hypothetical protein n=1 Tax=Streptomyces sp. NPDC005474 TaxID=3154878 RepID=UPI0034558D3B